MNRDRGRNTCSWRKLIRLQCVPYVRGQFFSSCRGRSSRAFNLCSLTSSESPDSALSLGETLSGPCLMQKYRLRFFFESYRLPRGRSEFSLAVPAIIRERALCERDYTVSNFHIDCEVLTKNDFLVRTSTIRRQLMLKGHRIYRLSQSRDSAGGILHKCSSCGKKNSPVSYSTTLLIILCFLSRDNSSVTSLGLS